MDRSTNPRLVSLRDGSDFQRFIGEFTNYENMKEYRYAGDTMSLERMAGLARDLGDPQESFESVHIAGTKGKGTTSLILEALLAASGTAVGTYTSPHVEHLRERIRLRGEPIADADLCALTNGILPVLEERFRQGPSGFPTFFELMTALAMLHFRKGGARWGIFEVGLGGRLDATNVLRPRFTAITSIGLEHTDKLGDTLALIAAEKAGIVKAGTPLVLGTLPPEADAVAREAARARGAPVIPALPDLIRPAGPGHLEVRGEETGTIWGPIPAGAVRGPALRADLALALRLWRGVLERSGREPTSAELVAALANLRLPARVEIFGGDPPAVIDGAHTPESVEALRLALEEASFPRPRGLVLALAADKPPERILEKALDLAETAVFTRADPVRGRDPRELQACWRQLGGAEAHAAEEPQEALELASRGGRAVVVTGSFYLAGKLRKTVAERSGAV